MITKKNLKTIVFINELALQVQLKGIGEVFISYAGHTNQIDVMIYEGNWKKHKNDVDFNHSINFRETFYLENTEKNNNKLWKLGYFLQQILNQNKMLNFDEINFIV
jgi:hypothetical protein